MIEPKRYRAKTNHTKRYFGSNVYTKDNEYVTGYYVFLPFGNVHHWIVSGGMGRGGYFCPHVHSIDINTMEEVKQ